MNILCICCESRNTHVTERTRTLKIGTRKITVANDQITACRDCGTTFYTAEQSILADRRLIDARKQQEGLLTSSQIKALRKSLDLSQAQLEAALGVGAKTVVRWENGTAVQSKALDDVLRLVQLDPDNLRLLVSVREQSLRTKVEHGLARADDTKRADLQSVIAVALALSGFGKRNGHSQLADKLFEQLRAYKMQRIDVLAAAPSNHEEPHARDRANAKRRSKDLIAR
ncbi:MAG: type II TA system antitoxin MqsA family protein [Candidatus Cybelea sp.]